MIEINFLRRRRYGTGWRHPQAVLPLAGLLTVIVIATVWSYVDLTHTRRQVDALQAQQPLWREVAALERQEKEQAAMEAAFTLQRNERWSDVLAGLRELSNAGLHWDRVGGQDDQVTLAARAEHLDRIAALLEQAATLPHVAAVKLLRAQQQRPPGLAFDVQLHLDWKAGGER